MSSHKRSRLASASNGSELPEGSQLVRSCKRCQERKIKCDGTLPYCRACQRIDNPECDVEDCVLWTAQHVKKLESRIEWLESQVKRAYIVPESSDGISVGRELQRRAFNPLPPDRLAEEVGLLSLRGSGSYVGSMSGVTLGSLVSSAIGLYGQGISLDDQPDLLPYRTRIRSGYPPVDIAKVYVNYYLNHVHRWYPFLNLEDLGRDLNRLYDEGTSLSDYGNFVLFMIFGISSLSKPITEAFTSEMYFHAAIGLIDGILARTSCDTIRALLLLCIIRLRSWREDSIHGINAWRITGLAVRIALELGLTRNNHRWAFEEEENEARRWLWWSLYTLERYVAIGTGRVLSIRNEAIDAHYPHSHLLKLPSQLLAFLNKSNWTLDVRPARHLLPQRKLLGEVMECVYITRPQDRPSVSIEATTERVYQLQADLVNWATQALSIPDLCQTDRDVLQLCFHQATMLLHRPSPSFPCPPPEALDVCLGAARGTIKIAATAVKDGLVDEIMPGWAGFSGVFISGMTLLYCSWANIASDNAIRIDQGGPSSDPDIQSSLETLQTLTVTHDLPNRYLSIYKQMVSAFSIMLAPLPIDQVLPSNSNLDNLDNNPLARAANEIGLISTKGLELDQEAMEFIQNLLVGTDDDFPLLR